VALLVGEILRRNAAQVPNAVAASLGEASLTHRELDRRANRLARALGALGVGAGDRVVCWTDTGLEVLELFAACAKLGAVFAPLNARLSPDEALPFLRLARPGLLVADAERAEPGFAVARSLEVAAARLGGPGPGADLSAQALRGERDDPPDASGLAETDPHVLFFTSGSTGAPKGVVLSHRASCLRTFQGVFRDVPEISVCMFPLFHMAGFTLALAAWQTRGEIALVRSPAAEELLAAVERRRANRLYCIPAVWARILESPRRADVSSLREVDTGTSATPPELVEALKERFPGTATRIYYGSTEAGAGTVLPDADVLRKPGSVGLPAPGVELRLDAKGEIALRSDYLMDGYFDDPEASAEALPGGWYRTGDLGALDEEGYLSIVGRVKDVIRTGGETVSPAEVEAALAAHPALAEVAVVGIPDPRWGEVVCAVVVPRPGSDVSLESLQEFCAGRLASFKRPRRMEPVDALPRTAATGQVQRALLVQRIAAGAPARR
jgi:acyl-CoA synthetase (AMP-forming)/AMP-acid ligase II